MLGSHPVIDGNHLDPSHARYGNGFQLTAISTAHQHASAMQVDEYPIRVFAGDAFARGNDIGLDTGDHLRFDRHGERLAEFSQPGNIGHRSEEHTSELKSLMRISYAVFCLNKKKNKTKIEK